jgi:hypothetical protein
MRCRKSRHSSAAGVTGLVMTKLDHARRIPWRWRRSKLPVRFIGVGETSTISRRSRHRFKGDCEIDMTPKVKPVSDKLMRQTKSVN